MATAYPPAGQPDLRPSTFGVRMQRFWRRVTEGLEVSQLWSQFEAEARASYRLYSRDVEAKTPDGLTHGGRRLHVVKEFFWAVFEKLSPARRVLLLLALIMLIVPHAAIEYTGQAGKVGVMLSLVGVQGRHQGPPRVEPLGLRERLARQQEVVHPEPALRQ